MEIQQQIEGLRGSFFIKSDVKKVAQMVYVMAGPTKMIIEHTEVDESLKGQGIGIRLLEALVDYVRAEEIKVIPLCPFAKANFAKRSDLQDVLN
jgi:predicted GNAT family acetyltransferase